MIAKEFQYPENIAFPRFEWQELGGYHEHQHLYREMLDRFNIDMPMVLRIEDRNGMAQSLEVRSPFLDHVMVETGFCFTQSDYIKGGENKWPLRQAFKDLLTPEVLHSRGKMRRPGNDRHVVYDYLAEPIRDMLRSVSFQNNPFWAKGLAARFDEDFNSRDPHRSFVWFRLYAYIRSVDILKQRQNTLGQAIN